MEFLELKEEAVYTESDLEQAIMDALQSFLLELGKGFTFVARQKRITFSEKHYWIDLVFYNRILQCFLLIDLKRGELTHKDLGQMQMYVNFYDRNVKLPHENKTIGLIICQAKEDAVIEYTLPEDAKQHLDYLQAQSKATTQARLRKVAGQYGEIDVWIDNGLLYYKRPGVARRIMRPISDTRFTTMLYYGWNYELVEENGEVVGIQGYRYNQETREWDKLEDWYYERTEFLD